MLKCYYDVNKIFINKTWIVWSIENNNFLLFGPASKDNETNHIWLTAQWNSFPFLMVQKGQTVTKQLFWHPYHIPKGTSGYFHLRIGEPRTTASPMRTAFELNLHDHKCSLMQLCWPPISAQHFKNRCWECSMLRWPVLVASHFRLRCCTVYLWWSYVSHGIWQQLFLLWLKARAREDHQLFLKVLTKIGSLSLTLCELLFT